MNNEKAQALKGAVVDEIVEKANASKALVVVTYHGLSVAKLQELRRALHKENCKLHVYKNTLVARAADKLGYEELKGLLDGPNAFIFSEDPTQGLKTIVKYSKRYKDIFTIKGAVIEGSFVNADELVALSKVPGGKQGLLSMFLSVLQAPIRQFACAVKAVADAK